MKNLLSTLLLLIFSVTIFSQTGNKNYVYCELLGTGQFMSNKVKVQVDFGQSTSLWKGATFLKDEYAKNISSNSMVDAMNFMGQKGWEFVQAYIVTHDKQNVYHWLLKKELNDEELNDIIYNEDASSQIQNEQQQQRKELQPQIKNQKEEQKQQKQREQQLKQQQKEDLKQQKQREQQLKQTKNKQPQQKAPQKRKQSQPRKDNYQYYEE